MLVQLINMNDIAITNKPIYWHINIARIETALNTSRAAVNRQYLNKPQTSLAAHVPGTLAQFHSIIPNFFVIEI